MIYLTGDLHHSSLCTGNQAHCEISEIQVAQKFLRLLEERDLPATLFVSGKSFVEEWDDLAPICASPLIEIGGHNYSCFQRVLWHRLWNKVLGSYNGPAWCQAWDARRTIEIIRQRTGQRIRSWRNHMYMHGPYTERVLANCGIDVCSDGVRSASRGPSAHPEGILNLPINVIPDHEHLYHAERTPEWVQRWVERYDWSDDFGSASYYIDEWVEKVLEGLRENEARGALSVMIIHPITMYLCDEFAGVERILDYLAERSTEHVSSVCRNGGLPARWTRRAA